MVRKLLWAPAVALAMIAAAGAGAATKSSGSAGSSRGVEPSYLGPRVGFSVDPDQFVVGGHMSVGFAPSWTFNPSIEAGFGDHETVTALNFDGEYHFRLRQSSWMPYVGAGIGVNFVHFDNSPAPNTSDTVTGLNLILGTGIPTASGQHLFTEMRIGAGDATMPQFKGIFGWNFRM